MRIHGFQLLLSLGQVSQLRSFFAYTKVTIKGAGIVTEAGTITIHKPSRITASEGKGIISTADGEISTYTAQDLGFTNETGYTTYLGIQIFTANTTGKMAFMDNSVVLYVYQNNAGGNRISGKIWE